jgi:hypothetical protein
MEIQIGTEAYNLGELQVLEMDEVRVSGSPTAFKYDYLVKNADRSSGASADRQSTD